MNNTASKKISLNLKFVYSDNNSLSVIFHDNDLLMGVVGEFNENLKELEKISKTSLHFRGNSILIKSDPNKNEIIKNAIQFLAAQFINNGTIEKKDIFSSINKFMIDEKLKNSNQNILDIIKTPKKSVIPRSERQKKYVRALRESDITISTGPAGTGKTFLAVAVALTMLLDKKIGRIILSRPAVEAGERLGFLPGDMKDKVDPYLRPLYDSLYDLLDFEKIQKRIEIGDIEIAPLAFMRGRTFTNSFVIVDEAQNTSSVQMKMVLTRIGEGSRMVINGDLSQVDLPKGQISGLKESKEILYKIRDIKIISLEASDVIRHPIVAKIIKAYDNITKDLS